jgi:hypothetical protein
MNPVAGRFYTMILQLSIHFLDFTNTIALAQQPLSIATI